MPFSEDDLRQALRRKDPGPEFTQQVMARLGQENAQAKAKATTVSRPRAWHFWLSRLRFGPALAASLAVLLLIGAWVG